MCVCVCVCVAETVRVRELKVILMLVLGRHECVRGKFYINNNKLVFSKSVCKCCRSHLAISSLDPPLINASTDYDYNERDFVFYMFYFVKYQFKAFYKYIYYV